MPDDLSVFVKFLSTYHPFRKMDEALLSSLAAKMQMQHYHEGDEIYQEGNVSDDLFIVYDGEVHLHQSATRGEDETDGNLKKGAIFGFEVWQDDCERMQTASAAADVTLLSVGWEALLAEADENDLLAGYLDMMLESQKLINVSKPEWLTEDETVTFLARSHPLFFWLKGAPAVILLGLIFLPLLVFDLIKWSFPLWSMLSGGISLITGLFWAIWVYVDWTNDCFAITDKRVVRVEKVVFFYDNRAESPLDAVLSVSTTTGYWGRLFGFGKIIIRTYTGNLIWDQVGNVSQIASMLEEKIGRSNEMKMLVEKKAKLDSIRASLGISGEIEEPGVENPPVIVQEDELTFGQWFASLFTLKTQQGSTVIYRKHWFLLLKRTWPAIFLMMGWLAFLTVFISGLLPGFSWQIVVFILGVWFIILGGVWIYEFVDWRNDQYILTEDQIIDTARKPLGSEEKRSAPIKNILSIEYKRLGLIGLLLNFGTVYIHIGEEEFTFDDVSDPSEVQHEISQRITMQKHREKQAAMEQERKQMVEWLEAYHQVIRENPENP